MDQEHAHPQDGSWSCQQPAQHHHMCMISSVSMSTHFDLELKRREQQGRVCPCEAGENWLRHLSGKPQVFQAVINHRVHNICVCLGGGGGLRQVNCVGRNGTVVRTHQDWRSGGSFQQRS